jgi:hypothetical protein
MRSLIGARQFVLADWVRLVTLFVGLATAIVDLLNKLI